MFTPIAALLNQEINITGSGSLQNRPVDFFDKILPLLNVKTITNNGKLPIRISGTLQPRNIQIDGTLSSQFLTGLLFAYSFKNVNATIKVNNLKSKPYIDLTLKILADFGLNTPKNNNYREFIFTPFKQNNNQPINYFIEGDWSNASFLLIAGAIAGNVTIKGLDINSTQADKAILHCLKMCGCHLIVGNDFININNTATNMQSFNFDATDCPDLFPPLVALAAYCNGISTIKGVSRLEHKESNRASVLQQEFGKMGLEIILDKDDMIINSTGKLNGANVSSNNDHRIAMACAVAALRAKGLTTIQNANAVNKSYPNFYSDLKKLGVVLYTNP
jgi:3-phosphoshikimate 1-carboxyvinyltransferase